MRSVSHPYLLPTNTSCPCTMKTIPRTVLDIRVFAEAKRHQEKKSPVKAKKYRLVDEATFRLTDGRLKVYFLSVVPVCDPGLAMESRIAVSACIFCIL